MRPKTFLIRLSLVPLLLPAIAGLLLLILYYRLPDPSSLQWENPKTTSFIEQKCRNQYCRYRWVPLPEISLFARQAVVLAEDYRFYQHRGIDWASLKDAFRQNVREREIVWGASSITMQLAKNLYLTPDKTIGRKLKEIILTFKLEQALSKDRILELYLNFAEWGPNLFGIAAASDFYFQKSPADLKPGEAAFLAALLPHPHIVGTAKWKEHVSRRGYDVFYLLLSHYLPPYRSKKEMRCEFRLNNMKAETLNAITLELFDLHAHEILSGKAALFTREQLLAEFPAEARTEVDNFLQASRNILKLPPSDCDRNSTGKMESFLPLEQDLPVIGKKNFWIAPAAQQAIQRLFAQAQQDGIPLILRSAYRNEGYQIYLMLIELRLNDYCISKTLQKVALPETSEHGCIDRPAFDFGTSRLLEIPFEETETFAWLKKNAPAFGFRLSYPEGNEQGIDFEPWHWQLQ